MWKMAHLWMYFLLKMMISHIYVPLPWGTYEYWMYDETPNPTYQLVTSNHPKCLGISGLFFPIFTMLPSDFRRNIPSIYQNMKRRNTKMSDV